MSVKIDGIPIERFNGVSTDEIYGRILPDSIDYNLDLVIVNICPTLYSVYLGSHYAGPGNHIWSCLYESGLTEKLFKADEDVQLLNSKIGLVNMLQKASSKGFHELSYFEIKEAQDSLSERICQYKPKIVAFNGKMAYEIYYGKLGRDFNFGKQSTKFENNTTNTYVYVLPTSESRGPLFRQLPKIADKIPFYVGLKKFKDSLNGNFNNLTDRDIMFPDFKIILEKNIDDMSDSEENTSILDENNQLNDSKSALSRNKKFYRLNNLPLSAIPGNVLEIYESQRLLKKDVVIPTSEKCFFENSSLKKNTKKVKDEYSDTISSVIRNVVMCDQGSNGAPSVASSVSDEATNDSDSFPGIANKSDATVKTETNESSQPLVKTFSPVLNIPSISKPFQQIQPKPTVLNLSSGNSTIKQILSLPVTNNNNNNASLRNITAQTVNLNQNIKISQQKPTIAQYSQPTKLTTNLAQNFKIVNSDKIGNNKLPIKKINEKIMPINPSNSNNINVIKIQNVQVSNESQLNNQIVLKDQNTIFLVNQNNKNAKNIKIMPKTSGENVQPQSATTSVSTNNTASNIVVNNNSNNNVTKPVNNVRIQPTVEAQNQKINKPYVENKTLRETLNEPIVDKFQRIENIPYIGYELIIKDKYRYGDYYTFNENPQVKVSDEEELRILNRVVKLHYDNDYELNRNMPVKRHFSDLKEANNVILNSSEIKRTCNLNLLNL